MIHWHGRSLWINVHDRLHIVFKERVNPKFVLQEESINFSVLVVCKLIISHCFDSLHNALKVIGHDHGFGISLLDILRWNLLDDVTADHRLYHLDLLSNVWFHPIVLDELLYN